jgi:hypothetical protein
MEKGKTFLSWWLFTFFSIASVIFIHQIGFFSDLYQNDQTKISFVIIFLYALMSIGCGKNAKKLDTIYHPSDEDKVRLKGMGSVTKFFATAFTTMGMIGTVIGFIAAFLPLLNLDTNNAEMVQEMASDLAGGIMTAMYTTLVGMVCGLFLAFQNLIVDRAVKKKLRNAEALEGRGKLASQGPKNCSEVKVDPNGQIHIPKVLPAKMIESEEKPKKKKKKKKNGK